MKRKQTHAEAAEELRAALKGLGDAVAAVMLRPLLALVRWVDRLVWRDVRPGEAVRAGVECRVPAAFVWPTEPPARIPFQVRRWPFSTRAARWLSRPIDAPRWLVIVACAIAATFGPFAGSAWADSTYLPDAQRAVAGVDAYTSSVLRVPADTYRLEEGMPGAGMVAQAADAEVYGPGADGTRRVIVRPRWVKVLAKVAEGAPLSEAAVDALYLATHESLHSVDPATRYGRGGALEEGATDAVAHDVLPGLIVRIYGRLPWWYAPPVAYPEEVVLVRASSAAATGSSWRSRAARLWRRQLLLADDGTRAAMMADANAKAVR